MVPIVKICLGVAAKADIVAILALEMGFRPAST